MHTLFQHYYMTDKNQQPISTLYLGLTVAFCVCLILANLLEVKTIAIGPATITAGFIVFPISYIINDCIVEVYGLGRARLMIWIGFAASLFVSLMLQLGIALPGSDDWTAQSAMEAVYGGVPRIIAASFIAFICGSMTNAYTMTRMKDADPTGQRFSRRAVISTLLGEGVDSVIFFPVAFLGILPITTIFSLIITQTLLKTLYEIAILPLTIRVVTRLKRAEGVA